MEERIQAYEQRLKRGTAGPYYLFKEGGEPSNHLVHDVLRGGVGTPPITSVEIERTRLVATDYALRSDTRLIERYCEPMPTRKATPCGDW